MPPIYRIHPGVGIARLGNSPHSFYLAPEQPAEAPSECDLRGNPLMSPDGMNEVHVVDYKDGEGRIRRQAARFQVWVYDDDSPEGRPLNLGDPIEGGGNAGTLVDIQWRVWVANKKAVWYQFAQLDGEHGYSGSHPRRNPQVVGGTARQRLIIDPGPRNVDCTANRRASFDRDGGGHYSSTFPPTPLNPESIDTLGDLLTDDSGRLLVLGGHGNSGSYLYDDFGQPRITNYANNDGWFDDTSDGPVMARLVMFSPLINRKRFVDVEYPAWVLCAYPRFVPEIVDVVTMEDVVEELAVTQFAERTDIYGTAGTFDCPQQISPLDEGALAHWRAGRLRWNPGHRPWFYRDVWPILFRPDQYSYLCSILGLSNYPHNYSTRGTFDPDKLSIPPEIYWPGVRACEARCLGRHHSGEMFAETLAPTYVVIEKAIARELRAKGIAVPEDGRILSDDMTNDIAAALASFAKEMLGDDPGKDFDAYLTRWRGMSELPNYSEQKARLEASVLEIVDGIASNLSEQLRFTLRRLTNEHLRKYSTGALLDECRATCIAANTDDPYRADRYFLFNLLRKPGEENDFFLPGKPSTRVHNLPLMPLLCGDNPITNTLPSKFLRLTEVQFYILRQWAMGMFYNEELEGWPYRNPWWPYTDAPPKTARELDRGVLANILGGAFCPGGEVGWIMRNPSVWRVPYRLKADPGFYNFGQTAAMASSWGGSIPEIDYSTYTTNDLSQDSDFGTGLQPGDLTKYMSVPWQSDYNECSTQTIDVTYEAWNKIYAASENDSVMKREQRVWETLWWPAHRPMQTNEVMPDGSTKWLDWTPGVPQTLAGDLKMVTEWWRLPFVIRNPAYDFTKSKPTSVPPPSPPPYISVQRTRRK